MTTTISVLVVEDHQPMREEFARMVEADAGLTLRGAADSAAAARALFRSGPPPEVVLVDLGLPDGNGIDLIREFLTASPSTSVLVATVFGDESHVIRALQAGAHGYLLKDTPMEEFSRAVRLVHEGGSPLSPQIARHLLKRFTPVQPAKQESSIDQLTAREIEVLTHVSRGFSVPETARLMKVSAHTITAHAKSIYSKLAVHSRIEAVNRAREKGLID
jgi:DNA-binding NarL/FixJ family response regulator